MNLGARTTESSYTVLVCGCLPLDFLIHWGECYTENTYLKQILVRFSDVCRWKQSNTIQYSDLPFSLSPFLFTHFHVILFLSFELSFNSFFLFFSNSYLIYFSLQYGRINYLFRGLPNLSKANSWIAYF